MMDRHPDSEPTLTVEPCDCWQWNAAHPGICRQACHKCGGTDRHGATWPPGMTAEQAQGRVDGRRYDFQALGFVTPVWGELYDAEGKPHMGIVCWEPAAVDDTRPGHRIELDEKGTP